MDSLSLEILRIYSSRGVLTLNQLSTVLNVDWMRLGEPVNYLRHLKYLCFEPNHAMLNGLTAESPLSMDDPLVITFMERAAFEHEEQSRKRCKYNEVRAWITLAIAVIALIVSIVALFV